MGNFDASARAAIHAVLISAAADVGLTITEGEIYKRSQINRVDWQSLVLEGDLAPPYIVENVSLRGEDPMLSGHNTVYRYAFDWHLIFSTNHALVADDAEGFAEKWAAALRDALYGYTGNVFACPERPSSDCSDENPANEVFYVSGHRLYAARVMASLRVGETIDP